jgi:hypothetical protein
MANTSLFAANGGAEKPKPRRIGVFGLGAGGATMAAQAIADGVAAVMLPLDAVTIQSDGASTRPSALPDLDAVVIAAKADDPTDQAAAVYRWARAVGVLVTSVVVTEGEMALAVGENMRTLRINSDILAVTTDEEYLSMLLQWLAGNR